MQAKKYKEKNKKIQDLDIVNLVIPLLFILTIAITFTVCFIVIKCSLTEFEILLKNPNYNPHATKEFTRYIWNVVSNVISSIIVYCLGIKQGQKSHKKQKDK